MQRARSAIVLLLALASSGCATRYGPMNKFKGGFVTTTMADRSLARITFTGNGFTAPLTVQMYAIYRCAEYAWQREASCFEVRDMKTTGADGIAYVDGSPMPY